MADPLQKTIFIELRRFLGPLIDTGGDPAQVIGYFSRLGWDIPALLAGGSRDDFVNHVKNIAIRAKDLEALAANPPAELEDFFIALAEKAVPILVDVAGIISTLPGGLPASVQDLPADVVNALTLDYLQAQLPATYELLSIVGMIDKGAEQIENYNGVRFRVKNARPALQFGQVNKLLKDPAKTLVDRCWPNGFADNGAGAAAVAQHLVALARAFGVDRGRSGAVLDEDEDPEVQIAVLDNKIRLAKEFSLADYTTAGIGTEVEFIDAGNGGPGARLTPFGTWTISESLGPTMLDVSGTASAGSIRITGAGIAAEGAASLDAKLALHHNLDDGEYLFVLGSEQGTYLRLQDAVVSAEFVVAQSQQSFKAGFALQSLQLRLGGGEGDGFLQKLLPPEGIKTELNLDVEWSTDGGIAFKGGSLEIEIPTHITIGPIELLSATIAVKIDSPTIPISLGVSVRGNLGPLVVVVENIGLTATLSFPAKGGNLGPVDAALGFKPPNGVGMVIDAGVVKGGGYLYFNFDEGEYAGALELTIADFLSLKTIVMITTKMPDGSTGFSLLVIITAEFTPGIQLGYGFSLIGVGGLLGLNRTVVLEALATGVRTGAVDGILFPVDPVANAPRIISDLKVIFPPVLNHFLIGPMAKIGWGASLVTLELGIIIEIPGNIAILGILRLGLPEGEEPPVLQLQVNFIGALEFDKSRGWFFAALYESRLLFITLEGELGLLIAVGNSPDFLLSAGGFHPTFTPPPLPFPSPRRLCFTIIDTSVARLRVEAYFAITPNTAQFGARAEAFFGYDSFSVQGHMTFDTLIRFSPLKVVVEIEADASLKVFGLGLFSIDLRFTLDGPTPWHARGRGTIDTLLCKFSADFNETWGEAGGSALPPLLVIPKLVAEIESSANWRSLPPPSQHLLVSLRKIDAPAGTLVLHPLGTLEVSQNAIPLRMTIDKVGAQLPQDANRFELTVTGGGLTRVGDAPRPFAPAQFRNMSDAQKLSSPAYQDEAGGLELAVQGSALRCGRAVNRELRYDLVTIDTAYKRFAQRFIGIATAWFEHLLKGNLVAKSALSNRRRKESRPFGDQVSVAADGFAVVSKRTNQPYSNVTASFRSESAAQAWLDDAAANDAALGSTLHIVPASDVERAA
jgi:hypothetical protein